MTRTLICLARHGETNWNLERRFQGQLDIALNCKGRSQARALARELGARISITSTAAICGALSTPPRPTPRRGALRSR